MPLQILPRGESDLEAFSNAASGLLQTIMQVKQIRRQREIKTGLMQIMSAGGDPQTQQAQIAQLLSGYQNRQQSGGGALQRLFSTVNPMTPAAVGTSGLENAIMGQMTQTAMDPMMGLKQRYMESQIGATDALTAERKRPKRERIIVYDEESKKSYYHLFDQQTGESQNTGKIARRPKDKKGKWGMPIKAGENDPYGFAPGVHYQISPDNEAKQIGAKPVKPTKPTKDQVQYWTDRDYTPKEAQDFARLAAAISAGFKPRASIRKNYDNMDDVAKLDFLTKMKKRAQGQYFGVEEGYEKAVDQNTLAWVEAELQKLPMLAGQPTSKEEPQTVEEFEAEVTRLKTTDIEEARAYYEKWVSKWQ